MDAADFRRIALSFPGAEESSHMGSPDFRVRLTVASEDVLTGALRAAWKLRTDQNAATRRKTRR